jgi:hypothetical protein
MLTTLKLNMKDPDRRRIFKARLAGKMIGVFIVMAAIYALTWYFGTQAGAAGLPKAAALKADDIVNPVNTMWVCVTAFLVFFMHAGHDRVSQQILTAFAGPCAPGIIREGQRRIDGSSADDLGLVLGHRLPQEFGFDEAPLRQVAVQFRAAARSKEQHQVAGVAIQRQLVVVNDGQMTGYRAIGQFQRHGDIGLGA